MKKRKKIPVKISVVKKRAVKKRIVKKSQPERKLVLKKRVSLYFNSYRKKVLKYKRRWKKQVQLSLEQAINIWGQAKNKIGRIRQVWQVLQGDALKRFEKSGKQFRKQFKKQFLTKKNKGRKKAVAFLQRAAALLQNRKVRRAAYSLTVLFIIFASLFYWYILRDLPNPAKLSTAPIPLTTRILDKNGNVLYRVYKDADRRKLSWEEIPQVVKDDSVAIEDANFYNHKGI